MASSATEGTAAVHLHRPMDTEGIRWRILASIAGPIAWLCFTLLYVGFWAQGFSVLQSVVVILVSALILAGVMGVLWTAWGMRHRREWFDD
jgi:hypothetical protein